MQSAAERELDNMLIAKEVMGWVMHPSWGCLAPPGYPSESEMWTPWEEGWDDDEGDFVRTRQPIRGRLVPGVVMDGSGKPKVPDYLGDIAAAWQVLEKVAVGDIAMDLTRYRHGDYCCTFSKEASNMAGVLEWSIDGWGTTAPLAICRAALKAVGAEVELEAV